eukprot:1156398-Pelagomonas_calceolata.AAC.12
MLALDVKARLLFICQTLTLLQQNWIPLTLDTAVVANLNHASKPAVPSLVRSEQGFSWRAYVVGPCKSSVRRAMSMVFWWARARRCSGAHKNKGKWEQTICCMLNAWRRRSLGDLTQGQSQLLVGANT